MRAGQTVAERPRPAHFWPTLLLFGLGEVIAIVLGLALGAYSGWKRGGPIDHVGNGALAAPVLDAVLPARHGPAAASSRRGLGWFPTFGMLTLGARRTPTPSTGSCDFGRHLVLPLATVALGLVGQYAILMRSSIIETLTEDYVTTARAKGLTDGRILRRHALPNALLPTVTLVAINLGYVVAGAITVEVVFNWPGLGTLTVDALAAATTRSCRASSCS